MSSPVDHAPDSPAGSRATAAPKKNRVEFWSGRILYPAIGVLLVVTVVGVFGAGPMRRYLFGTDGLVGQPAADFSLPIAAGGDGASRIRLSHLRGRTVVLEFWATWCPPCREQMPYVAALRRELRDRPVDVIGINVEPGLPLTAIAQTSRDWRGDYLHLRDDGEVALAYRVESLPTTVVIDRDGNVAAVHRGGASPAVLRSLLTPAMEAR